MERDETIVLDPTVREQIGAKRLIFTVATGRSGTKYLAEILQRVDGVFAQHEAPTCFSAFMRYVQEDPVLAKRFLVDTKLPEIGRKPRSVYADTTHLFCKGFFEPLVELGFVPDLILLRRDKRKVARSIFLLDSIPGNSRWYLGPDDPGVLPLKDWRTMHDYQLCYWYCLEIEHRAGVYGAQARELGARVVDVDLSELTGWDGVTRLLDGLDLPRIPPLRRFRMWLDELATNQQHEHKQRANRFGLLNDLDLDELEAQVLARVGG